MPAPGVPTAGRRGAIGIALAAAGFVVVASASTSGPVPLAVERDNGPSTPIIGVDPDSIEPEARAEERPVLEPVDSTTGDVLAAGGQIIAFVVVATIVFLVGRQVLRALQHPPPARWPDPEAEQAPPSGPQQLIEAVDDGSATMASGPVDDVIIACWQRLERAAAAAGLARQPAETSTELTVRMLSRLDVPEAPIGRLLGRYHAARFSRHRLGEDDRIVATAALGEIRAAIGRAGATWRRVGGP